ncbi:hypothetical protein QA640_04335 [Bradyrhizobium sp. CB82]|uniref:hypothetical protein n=1 Tax=Bradyrhizobium sp. CB82 TaxID=3039159 RepID=UPI0024B1116A|nr:hypothetical protein [Bradyrhizobium sp. CB82]WFU41754.1 hypothetical protein QA640_04335 [Bradyrhizobium sp. CB82]
MRALTAYFVGGGTIVAAIAIGLGGGIVAGNIMNPIAPKRGADAAKLERRAESTATTNAPSERVQYLTGSQVFGAAVAPPVQAEAPTATANAEPSAPRAQPAASRESRQANTQAAQPAKPAEQQAATEQAASPDNANAKAKDADVKRAASERHRADRRQRWAERRRYDARDPRDMRDRTDWDDVARSVREDADAREFGSGPRRVVPQSRGVPQIRLFGDDDDE